MTGSARPSSLRFAAEARLWFISDLHLWDDRPQTTQRFTALLARAVSNCDALFILGDLFEYWAGDDDLASPHVAAPVEAMRRASQAGLKLWLMHGNRDFLLGDAFAQATGVTLIEDPCEVDVDAQTLLLAHGDALCTDDTDYQQFRRQVRQPAWQAAFLARPLAERHAMIAAMRARSEDKKSRTAAAIMDVNGDAVADLLQQRPAKFLIHGHTHRPAFHPHAGTTRAVLPDWEYDELPTRGGGYAYINGQLLPLDV